MTVLHGHLEVTRVVLNTTDNEQIMAAPGDKQFAVAHKAQIPGPQKRHLAAACDRRMERPLRLLLQVPIGLPHNGSGDPDLSELIAATHPPGIRVDK